MELPNNFILIDKPKGSTSFDVIRQLRAHTGIKKWGHAGTLDPLATGLMILAYDSGTKRLGEYIKLDKEYIAEIRIGERRSTGDMEGEVLEERDVVEEELPEENVATALASMVSTLMLPVSAYSAIKKDGVPMYKRARKAEKTGATVDPVPAREMVVYDAELLNSTYTDARCIVTARFSVGSGTYIRSLAEDLGQRLGYPATLQNLRRTKVGACSIANAKAVEDVRIKK